MKKTKKTALIGKSKIKNVVYDRFSTFAEDDGDGTLGAIDSLNCTSVDGVLAAGVGISIYYTVNDDEVVYRYQEPHHYYVHYDAVEGVDCLGIMTFEGWAYYVNEEELSINTFRSFYQDMEVYNCFNDAFEEILLVVGGGGIYQYTKEGESIISDLTSVQANCKCKDRLFIVVSNYLFRYSAPLDYLNFSETLDDSGVLYLPSYYGMPTGMVAFGDNVYIFYEYHIMELQAAGAARDFRLRELEYVGGKILEKSMTVFGDKLIFFAENGVYSFDGKRIKKAYEKLNVLPKRKGRTFCSAVCDGKLLVRYVDNNEEDKTVALYPDGEYGYYTTLLKGVGTYKGETFCLYKNKFYKVRDGWSLPSGEYRYFRSVAQDFGVNGRKTLKKLHFEGVGTVHFDVYVDGVCKVKNAFARYDDKDELTFDLDLRGEEFSFVLYASSISKLWRLTAVVEYV